MTAANDALVMARRRLDLLELSEEIADVGHWRLDLGCEVTFWSPQVYRIYGLDPATHVPTIASGLAAYHAEDRERVSALVGTAMARGEPFEFESRIQRPDGQIRFVHCKARCESDAVTGITRAVVGVFQDITERKALQDALVRQERLVTTGTLAAGIGHEINNPLTFVGANIDQAIEALRGQSFDRAPVEVDAILAEAREGVDRIAKIVHGLRSFASEKAPLASMVPANVTAAIEVSMSVAVHELRGRATVSTEIGDVECVRADKPRLSQILVSLLVNAAQAFPTSDPSTNRIVVRAMRVDAESIAIEVEDNGPGIPRSVLPSIFDAFFTTKEVGKGMGLGLSVSANIAEAVGGRITCASEVGRGTTFRVLLPAARPSLPLVPSRSRNDAPSHEPKRRVLAIDDEPSLLRAVERMLQPMHEVTTVTDPRDALRLVDGGASFDVILCDLMMPYLNGMDVHRELASRHPRLAARVVFITGGILREDVRSFLATTERPCLEKPFGRAELLAAVRAVEA